MTVKEKIHQIVETLPEPDAEALLHQLNGEEEDDEEPPKYGIKALSAALLEMGRNAPQEELDRMPIDLSENLDHYIYGTPKK